MKSGTRRPWWGGFLSGAGLALFAMWPLDPLLPMVHERFRLLGFLGLALVCVGFYLHSPLHD
jgi:hypothetical protein